MVLRQLHQINYCRWCTRLISIIQILAANTEIVNDRINILTKKIDDIQESLEFTEKDLKERILMIENRCSNENLFLKNKLRDLEDRSRRNNHRNDGVSESESETWEEMEEKVFKIFEENLGQKGIVVERTHRAQCPF